MNDKRSQRKKQVTSKKDDESMDLVAQILLFIEAHTKKLKSEQLLALYRYLKVLKTNKPTTKVLTSVQRGFEKMRNMFAQTPTR